ncbi:helix-turn-helix domain-containing protein [Weissella cibaria]|uniref:helix-turn-helix domain-containing protein n=1 Tax=Weissella cibaria TaxID=137591 RepID=UPI001E3675FC|nr:helix-turn-helix transcriptional regulator [Weissella cibaria]MCC6123111.1 helix-turn-helix domain-containing protein [Weissella cibaria]MCT0953856.1 XRE family transcriptional regulator [Weissella cibaria]
MTVLERIKEVSKLRGYNLTKVNEMAHLGKNTIYSWKTKEPSHNNLQAVADVLGVSVDYLLGNTDEMHSNKKDAPYDLKEFIDSTPVLKYDGKDIPEAEMRIIRRILEDMDD